MTYEEHGNHLCRYELNRSNLDEFKKFVRDVKYMCKHHGGGSVKAENLCVQEPL